MATRNERRRQWQHVGYFWCMVMQAVVVYYDKVRRTRRLPRTLHRNWDNEREMTLQRMFGSSDRICHEQLRMKIGPFMRLCARLQTYGLVDSKSVSVEEQLAMFLNTVGHDHRNRATSFTFFRSGQTVSYYFHRVLHACIGLYRDVVTNATNQNSPYEKENVKPWYTFFQDAVGAIDGTHIAAQVPVEEQARYRNRKQMISQNVLVACTFDMKFTYVLAGWEGSAHDGRLLRNAILRQGHKLTIPCGTDESVNDIEEQLNLNDDIDPSHTSSRKRKSEDGTSKMKRRRTKPIDDSVIALSTIAESSKKIASAMEMQATMDTLNHIHWQMILDKLRGMNLEKRDVMKVIKAFKSDESSARVFMNLTDGEFMHDLVFDTLGRNPPPHTP